MRVGEAIGLTWSDVYFAEGRIAVGASGRVKNATSNRDVPFDSTLASALGRHSRCHPARPSDPVSLRRSIGMLRRVEHFARHAGLPEFAALVFTICGTPLRFTLFGLVCRFRDFSAFSDTPVRS